MSRSWNGKRGSGGIASARVIAAVIVLGACGGGERSGTAAGEAAPGEVAALDYEVTPERYQQWVAAQQALDAIPGLPEPPKIDPLRLDEAQVQRATEYLESDARARAALARAGISARDYVLTTVALDQALVSAATSASPAAPGAAPSSDPAGSGGTGGRSAATPTPTPGAAGAPAAASAAPTRPRVVGAPARNVELVQRNRADVVRVLRTMRFRVSEPAATDLPDTAVTRSDSVTVGKDLTVKWDVTVRRNRDSAAARRRAAGAKSDSTPPDSTER